MRSYRITYTGIVVAALFFSGTTFPGGAWAQNMSSSNFQVQNGTFGSGGVAHSSSTNYIQSSTIGEVIVGDRSASSQYEVGTGFGEIQGGTTTTSTPNQGSGGGGVSSSGGGGGGRADHITAFNTPLVLPAGRYSGTLTQTFDDNYEVIVNVPKDEVAFETHIRVERIRVSSDQASRLTTDDVNLVGDSLFRIIVTDAGGNRITHFRNPVDITITVSGMPDNSSQVGLYSHDTQENVWRNVHDATIDNREVTFTVDHPADFAVFQAADVPPLLAAVASLFRFETLPEVVPAVMSPSQMDNEDGESLLSNPAQLFDIAFSLNATQLHGDETLFAQLSFENFGTEPTPVDVVFVITDAEGNEVYRDEGEQVDIVVETEAFLTRNFDAVDFSPGEYEIVVTTRYGENITDEFSQSFSVSERQPFSFTFWLLLLLVLLIIAWGYRRFFFAVWRKRERSDEEL